MDDDETVDRLARLADFVERSADLVGVLDGGGRVVYLNETARKRLGFGDAMGLTAADFFGAEAFARYYDEIRPALLRTGMWTGEMAIRTQAGEALPIWCELIADVAPGGEIRGMVTHGRVNDDEGVPRFLTTHERRVGVIEVALRDVGETGTTHDALTSEGVQRAAARRLALHVRASDMVVRVDTDRFAVVHNDVRDLAELMRHAKALQEVFSRGGISSAAGELEIDVEVRPVLGEPGRTIEQVLAQTARDTDDNAWRDALPVERAQHDPAISDALQLAVMRGELPTHVLPVIDQRGSLIGYAAFATWAHPAVDTVETQGLYALADDVPGVRAAIDLRVLREAAAVAATSPGNVPIQVFAPIGASLLDDVYLEQYAWEIADSTGLSTDQIHLIVDYTLVAGQPPKRRDALQALRDSGYAVVIGRIDDRVDLDALIDRYHPSEVHLDERAISKSLSKRGPAALSHLVDASHKQGVRVIAPGIDSNDLRSAALQIGIDYTMGAVYGKSTPTNSIV